MIKQIFLVYFLCCFSSCNRGRDETVFLSILARNKAHYLPRFLQTIENLDYNKKLITVYINTNNNTDQTEDILEKWIEKNKKSYASIIYEKHNQEELGESPPHYWPTEKTKKLAMIRNHSLDVAKRSGCDYYFVVDIDNFIVPSTLTTLIDEDKPIIAPLLRSIPENEHYYCNFFYDVKENGYYNDHPDYWKVIKNEWKGSFKVPVVHCTYLIKSEYLDKLNYLDDSKDHEFIVFSRNACKAGISQYICNLEEFGVQFNFHNSLISLEEERQFTKPFLAMPWEKS